MDYDEFASKIGYILESGALNDKIPLVDSMDADTFEYYIGYQLPEIGSYDFLPYLAETSVSTAYFMMYPENNGENIEIGDNLIIFALAQYIAKKMYHDKLYSRAFMQGDIYSRDKEKVDYYGSKGNAFNHGVDKYMLDNPILDDTILYPIYEKYLRIKEAQETQPKL